MLQCRQLFQIIRLYIGAVDNPLLFPTCSVSHHNPDTREALADKTASVTFRNAEEVALLPPLPLAFFLPPSPRPPSPMGKGEIFFLYFAGGSAPGTPALNRLRHLQSLPNRHPAGAEPARHLFTLQTRHPQGAEPARHWLSLPLWCLKGGLPSLPPAAPAFSFFLAPIPPPPFPHGEGGDF